MLSNVIQISGFFLLFKFKEIRRNADMKQSAVCSLSAYYFGSYTVSTEYISTSVWLTDSYECGFASAEIQSQTLICKSKGCTVLSAAAKPFCNAA